MNAQAIDVLLIEDNPGDVRLIRAMLAEPGRNRASSLLFRLVQAGRLATGLAKLEQASIDVILLDLSLPDSQGFDTFTRVRAHSPDVPVILLTGLEDEMLALKAVQNGAQDYLVKDQVNEQSLPRAIYYAIERNRLDQERRLLSAAIEQTAESIVITDAAGNILYINPAFEQITGYSRSEVINQTMRLLNSGKQEPAFYDEMWATIKAGQVWSGRFINKKKDGMLYTADTIITPVRNKSGEIVNYVGIQRDVTRELRREEQYRQIQKMEAVGRLAGGIAHDFNNLLTVITGYTELLIEVDAEKEGGMQPELQQIQRASNQASALTHQLLAFSRKPVGQLRLINLNEIVIDMDKLLQRLIGEDIDLVTRPAPDLGYIKADPSQIEQIIMNLAINARDAMPQGGKLTVETANIELDEEYTRQHIKVKPGIYVMLAISDTGIGMDAKTQENIFEPFFTTKGEEGTGLGLAIVYGIVKQYEGHIWVYSEQGQGTTFKIYLPQVEQTIQPLLQPRLSTPVQKGVETVLLVEDEMMVRKLAHRALHLNGYFVLEAQHGAEAIQICLQHKQPIDLLLTDMVMPGGLTGPQLADYLITLRPKMKVLYMSGYADNALVHHEKLGVDAAFLQKPFTPAALVRRVREVLDTD